MGNNTLFKRAINGIGIAITVALVALWIGFHTGVLNALVKGYDCDSLKPEIVALSEKNATTNSGVTIVGIVKSRETSKSRSVIECTGTAKWSNVSESQIAYKAYLQEDQWFLEYRRL